MNEQEIKDLKKRIENDVPKKLGMWLGRMKSDIVMNEMMNEVISERIFTKAVRLVKTIFRMGLISGYREFKKPLYRHSHLRPSRTLGDLGSIDALSWDDVINSGQDIINRHKTSRS